jgi:hypothetical protein
MKEGQYYMTIADEIYGMSRKCFIYVHKVCKKVFFYNYIDDWQFIKIKKDGKQFSQTQLKINKLEKYNYRGKLSDADAFKMLNRETLVLSSNCP